MTKKQNTIPFVIGHRGACGHAPENTLPSFEKAMEYGVRWVEVDVKLSSDGVAFLMHDDSLERTTDGEGLVAETPWSKLAKLDAGRWFDAEYTGTRLLRFEDAIGHLDAMGVGLNIEIKGCAGREEETAEIVCNLVEDGWPSGLPAPIFSSFEVSSLMRTRELLPDAAISMLFNDLPDDWRDICGRIGASGIHIWNESVDPGTASVLRDAGYALRAFTVNQRTRAGELKDLGFSGIFCDFPERMTGL